MPPVTSPPVVGLSIARVHPATRVFPDDADQVNQFLARVTGMLVAGSANIQTMVIINRLCGVVTNLVV